jgi:hypothetical protein
LFERQRKGKFTSKAVKQDDENVDKSILLLNKKGALLHQVAFQA